MARKDDPATVEYETRAKNLLKAELKRRNVSYQQLAEKLAALDRGDVYPDNAGVLVALSWRGTMEGL